VRLAELGDDEVADEALDGVAELVVGELTQPLLALRPLLLVGQPEERESVGEESGAQLRGLSCLGTSRVIASRSSSMIAWPWSRGPGRSAALIVRIRVAVGGHRGVDPLQSRP